MNHVATIEPAEPHPRADECQAQLHRILSSPDFEATEREHRFLAYITEETLAGRGNRIKAYSIAVEVFGREASFDAQNDPIVRIAAGHLRRALERYYLTGGRGDPIVISIPKGCYVPTFAFAEPQPVSQDANGLPTQDAEPIASSVRRLLPALALGLIGAALIIAAVSAFLPAQKPRLLAAPEIPRILVLELEDLSRSESSASIASGLTQEIVSHLSKFKNIVVVQAVDASQENLPPARFGLAGSVDLIKNHFRIRVRLVNNENDSIVWANSYDGPLDTSGLLRAQSDIAKQVATTLAQSYGVIFQADSTRSVSMAPDDWAAYSCTLSYYAYRLNVDRKALPEVRKCLEQSVERFPAYATGWALLAQTYLDDVRFRFPYDPTTAPAEVERALGMARHAVQLEPSNVRGMQAEMFALFFSKQYEAARRVGEKALSTNPNDTELMGEYGYRLALSGDWGRGCPLVSEAQSRNPAPSGYYESALALCAYFAGDYERAKMWIERTPVPRNPLYHLIAAAVLAEAGETKRAAGAVDWICSNQPSIAEKLHLEVSARLGREEDVRSVLASLGKAGLISGGVACPRPAVAVGGVN